jgi:hypothetical protein
MDFITTKLTAEQQILDAVKDVRTPNAPTMKKNKAIRDLIDTYKFDLDRELNKVMKYVRPGEDRQQIFAWVASVFTEILLAKNLEYDTKSRLDSYLRRVLHDRINKSTLRTELEYDPLIHDIKNVENSMQRGIAKFHKQEHHEPDFRDEQDVKTLAIIMQVSPEVAQEWINILGSAKIKSMYEQVSGEDSDDDKLLVMDSLKSGGDLPDELYENKMLLNTIDREMKHTLTPEEYNIFQLYFHFNDPDAEELTREQITAKTGVPLRRVKYLLDIGREKLKRNHALQQWVAASEVRKLVKLAMQNYQLNIVNGKFRIAKIIQSNETIIDEVVKFYGVC